MVDLRAHPMTEPTYSIFARAFRIEAPFLNEWLEHHFALGFDIVYLCVAGRGEDTKAEREFVVERIAPEFLPRIRLLESPDHQGVAAIYQALDLQRVWGADERVLIIDVDEFLVLQHHATIREFRAEMGLEHDALFIEWVNHASDDWGYDGLAQQVSSTPPWVGVNGKSLVRGGSVDRLKVHRHSYVRDAKLRDVDIADACLLHLCSRGLADILCRVLYDSVKTNPDDIAAMRQLILGPEMPETLPRRLILLHAQTHLARLDDHPNPLAKPLSPLKFGGDSDTLMRLVGRALGANTPEEEIERVREARDFPAKYEVTFTNTPAEIREIGSFVAMCNRLQVVARDVVRDGAGERVRYTVSAVPDESAPVRKKRGWRLFRRLRKRG